VAETTPKYPENLLEIYMTHNNEKSMWHKAYDAGFTRLVPVIPPKATLSPRSKIGNRASDPRGKVPGIPSFDGSGWVGLDYHTFELKDGDLDRFSEAGASIAIKTGNGLIALDIDVTDGKAAAELSALAEDMLGKTAIRIGRAPKILMLFRTDEDMPFESVSFSTETEDRAMVEVLASDRKFTAFGDHPKTGKPYDWPEGFPEMDTLATTTPEAIKGYLAAVSERMPDAKRRGVTTGARNKVDQKTLLASNIESLVSAVAAIPNTSEEFPTRDDYVKMACAIKAACGPAAEMDGMEIFLDWCDRWDGENDLEVAEADFEACQKPFAVGSDWIFTKAMKHGWDGIAEVYMEEEQAPVKDLGFDLDDIPMGVEDAPAAPTIIQPGRKKLSILSLSDIADLPDPMYLVDSHIPEKSFGLMFGAPGTFKSFFCLDIALRLAFGMNDWHGYKMENRNKGAVLYIAGEGAAGFKARIAAWCEHHGKDPRSNTAKIMFLHNPVNFLDGSDVNELMAAVDERVGEEKLSLAIIDTVSRSIPGAEENSAKDMTVFIASCDALKDRYDCTALGVHHEAKGGGMRGSSTFHGQADFVLQVKRNPGAKQVKMHVFKQKDATDGYANDFTLMEVGNSLVPMFCEPVGAADGASLTDLAKTRIIDAIDAAWNEGNPYSSKPQSKGRYLVKFLKDDQGLDDDQAKQIMDFFLNSGELIEDIFDKGSKKKGLRSGCINFLEDMSAEYGAEEVDMFG
jgi:hypothetical protein